ncbi:hypothetical protein CLV44_10358 [Marinobacterium halophilum]|uniref:Uncharacterized protein n=1 Tax=Marinobacterium halophilum TaxID=267374 RepID=A0A2P8F236_9GAMM|nr:hypothetical protein [Marinobacterium halophilum]PSL15777.1 hypothetical protein CLV44_10358 [Marinobacterium halophilum]
MSTHASALPPAGLKVLSVLLLLLALPLGYLGFTTFVAALSHQQAKLFLDHWGDKKTEPSVQAWQVAVDASEHALSWSPGSNGAYADTQGRVYEWYQVQSAPFGDSAAELARRKALAAYRQSVESRPLWPYTRVQVAYAKLRLLEFDAEFDTALVRARTLGEGRVRVHAPLVEIGMIAWPSLDAEQRAATWESLALLLRYAPRKAKSLQVLAQKAGLYPQLCVSLDPDLLKQRGWCQPAP